MKTIVLDVRSVVSPPYIYTHVLESHEQLPASRACTIWRDVYISLPDWPPRIYGSRSSYVKFPLTWLLVTDRWVREWWGHMAVTMFI